MYRLSKLRIFRLLISIGLTVVLSMVAHAEDATVSSNFPTVYFDDTDEVGSSEWQIWADQDYYVLYNIATASQVFFVDDATPFSIESDATTFRLYNFYTNSASIDIDRNSGAGVLYADAGGNVQLADGTIYINKSATNVGIGTGNPSTPLHVESQDGKSASLLVKNPIAPTAAGDVSMFVLQNTGDKIVRFIVNAGGGNAIWTFDNEPTYNAGAGVNSGRFRIAKSGTGVPEFTVDGYGNGQFWGTSTAVNHINTSSRETKTDFQALDERDVLAKLMQLPVTEWRYKQEGTDTRHIGPVAEDFQQMFGLGDGKHISTVDSDGVALAAIKGVYQLVQEKAVEIEALRRDNESLMATNKILADRLQALEDMMHEKQLMKISRR
jgi:hypothetical protein